MPLLNVTVTGQPDPARSASIASTLTELTAIHLGKERALTAVTIRSVAHDEWFIGGEALSRRDTNSFALRIMVTEGTNTKSEIAAYIAAVFSALSEILGSLRDESYIVVDQVPAAQWGYAGETQEFRFIAGKVRAPGEGH